jgi:hypothetical protein
MKQRRNKEIAGCMTYPKLQNLNEMRESQLAEFRRCSFAIRIRKVN